MMQSFVRRSAYRGPFRAAAYGAYEAARACRRRARSSPRPPCSWRSAASSCVLWLGAQDVVAGRITGGMLTQFVLYAVLGAGALGQLSEVWNEVSQAAGAAGRIGELLAVKPRIAAARPARAAASPSRGAIAFDGSTSPIPAATTTRCSAT